MDNTITIKVNIDTVNQLDFSEVVKTVAKKQKALILEAFRAASPDVEKEMYAILHAPLVKVEFVDDTDVINPELDGDGS